MKTTVINFLFAVFLLSPICYAQSTENSNEDLSEIEKIAESLVKDQLVAYNNRDIEKFLEPYSDSIKAYNYPNQLLFEGKGQMRSGYANLFKNSPNLNCEIVSRMILGNKVIDQESVTGFGQDENRVLNAIAIYTIENGKIQEVRFLRR